MQHTRKRPSTTHVLITKYFLLISVLHTGPLLEVNSVQKVLSFSSCDAAESNNEIAQGPCEKHDNSRQSTTANKKDPYTAAISKLLKRVRRNEDLAKKAKHKQSKAAGRKHPALYCAAINKN